MRLKEIDGVMTPPQFLLPALSEAPATHRARWFTHHVAPGELPVLLCRLHRGQLAHGDQFRRRCHGWSEPLLRRVTPLQE